MNGQHVSGLLAECHTMTPRPTGAAIINKHKHLDSTVFGSPYFLLTDLPKQITTTF